MKSLVYCMDLFLPLNFVEDTESCSLCPNGLYVQHWKINLQKTSLNVFVHVASLTNVPK